MKPKKQQDMHNVISHHPLTNAQVIHPSQPAPPSLCSEHGILWYGTFLSCPGNPLRYLCTSSLVEHGKLKIPSLVISTT